MKFKEIEKIYTNKIAWFINSGYHIDIGTMRGSQGETAKIDLTDGKNIYRIWLKKTWETRDLKIGRFFPEIVKIVVGICCEKPEFDEYLGYNKYLWDDDFTIIEEEVWTKVGKDWYLPRDKANELYGKKEERLQRTIQKLNSKYFEVAPDCGSMVLNRVRRERGMKRVKADEIKVFHCLAGYPGIDSGYYAKVNGSTIRL